jgi:hypothetical protein
MSGSANLSPKPPQKLMNEIGTELVGDILQTTVPSLSEMMFTTPSSPAVAIVVPSRLKHISLIVYDDVFNILVRHGNRYLPQYESH